MTWFRRIRRSSRSVRQEWEIVMVGLGLLLLAPTGRAEDTSLDEGWRLLSRFLYRDAAEAFRAASPADDRLRKLGLAASLLNEPPITAGKLVRAETILQDLIATAANDETSIYARYLLARIFHMHRETPVPEIEAAYRAVIAVAPQSPPAQLAAGHLALVLLYQRPDLSIAERLASAEKLAKVVDQAALPEVGVSYYRALANAALYYGITDARVVGWLQQAHEIGSSDQITQATLSLQIAECARALGQKEKAVTFYRDFLATAVPTDQRYHTAEVRMHELEEAGR